jgi:hypothetical protein
MMRNLFKQKKYIAFFTVVPLLLTTAMIKVPCPVCEGKGTVSNTGMDMVRVINVASTVQDMYIMDTCLNYRIYEVDVTVTLQNDNHRHGARGFLRLALIDETLGKMLDDQIVVADVPAESRVETSYSVYFLTLIDDPVSSRVGAGVLTGEVPDQVCGGTGRIPLNSWLFYNATLEQLIEIQRIEANFEPRQLTDSEIEELMGQEGNTDQWYDEHGDTIYY